MIGKEEQERTYLDSVLAEIVARFNQARKQLKEEAKDPNQPTDVKINCLEDSITILVREMTHE